MLLRYLVFIMCACAFGISLLVAYSSGQRDIRINTVVMSGSNESYRGVFYGGCAIYAGRQFCAHDTREGLDGGPEAAFQSTIDAGNLSCQSGGHIWSARSSKDGSVTCVMADSAYPH